MKFCLVVFCIALTSLAFPQNIDSLKRELKLKNHDTSIFQIKYQLEELNQNLRIGYWDSLLREMNSKSILYNDKKIQLVFSDLRARIYNTLGYIYKLNRIIDSSKFYYMRAISSRIKLIDEAKNTYLTKANFYELGWVYNNLALAYRIEGIQELVLNSLELSLKYYVLIKDQHGMAMIFNNLASFYNNIGDVSRSLDYNYKALAMFEKTENKKSMAYNLNNIGLIYHNQGDNRQAFNYFNKALEILEILKANDGIAMVLHNKASIFDNEGDGSKALLIYQKSLKLRRESNNKSGEAYCLNSIASIYLKQKKYSLAINYFTEALQIRELINEKQGIAISMANLAGAYLAINKLLKAQSLAENSLQLSMEIKIPACIKNAAEVLKKIYFKMNNYKKSLNMYELEIQMRDSINNTETKKAAIKKQFQYQYEKKAAADSVKNAEEQKVKNAQLLAQQAQLKQEKTQRLALYGGLMLVIAFSFFVFNRFKLTQKQKVIIEKQKNQVDNAYEQLHEKNKEVMDSIHYAARIQRSLITNEKYIAKNLNRLNEK